MKELARLTKKKELDSKIDRRNEEIDILKAGLSGIVRKYEFKTVQEFYIALKTAQNALYKFKVESTKW